MSQASAYPLLWYSTLLRVRPAQVCELVKRLAFVRRTYVSTKTGHQFWVDPVSIFGLHLLRDGVHERLMTRLVQLLLRPFDVFIDIGGNEGYFSVMAASQIREGAVHCIEPQSRLQQILRKNLELNGSRIILHQTAISNRDGYVDLFLRPSTNTGASSLFRHWKLGSKTERVPCVTLDSLLQQHSIPRVRLIKVDCEGAEGLVIEGAKHTLSEHRVDFIAMEYHSSICGSQRCLDTHRQLTSVGYVLTRISELSVYHLPSQELDLQPLSESVETFKCKAQ
jgi:FkbM family methyltransferase